MSPPKKRKVVRVTVSKEDIEIALKELGLRKGDIIGVHSSLSSFGYVKGGADAVIDALHEVVGREGTIVMPTHSANLDKVKLTPKEKAAGVLWLYKILPYDPKGTPCTTGVIPQTFRKRKDVTRSLHPLFSVAATGPKAKEIIEEAHGNVLKAWKKLLELDGYILLICVDLGVCTAMHLVDERIMLPAHILEKITPPKWFVEKYPEDQWEWDFAPYPGFSRMEEPCLEHEIMKTTKVGEATLKLVKLRDLIDLYEEYLKKNPDKFYAN
ncbi:AAC(3) family N-acetyltransferase [Candidatus Bathyarchaeota archaeon]|nr:AAC(3) family N-acetyltransferase [Candidatus Bathyarchaeota archaeon]